MVIQVIGGGCRNCKKLLKNVNKALKLTGLSAEVNYVTSPEDIAASGLMQTPGLKVDGQIWSAGTVLSPKDIAARLRDAAGTSASGM